MAYANTGCIALPFANLGVTDKALQIGNEIYNTWQPWNVHIIGERSEPPSGLNYVGCLSNNVIWYDRPDTLNVSMRTF